MIFYLKRRMKNVSRVPMSYLRRGRTHLFLHGAYHTCSAMHAPLHMINYLLSGQFHYIGNIIPLSHWKGMWCLRVWVVLHILITWSGQYSSVELCCQYLSISTAQWISLGIGKEKDEEEHVCAMLFDVSLALTTSKGRRDGARLNDNYPQSPVQFSCPRLS